MITNEALRAWAGVWSDRAEASERSAIMNRQWAKEAVRAPELRAAYLANAKRDDAEKQNAEIHAEVFTELLRRRSEQPAQIVRCIQPEPT